MIYLLNFNPELDEEIFVIFTNLRLLLVRSMKRSRRETFETHKPVEFVLDVGGPACELLALFLADKPVHALVAKHGFPAIAQEYAGYREERILKLLIEIATSYRLVSWRLFARAASKGTKRSGWPPGDRR